MFGLDARPNNRLLSPLTQPSPGDDLTLPTPLARQNRPPRTRLDPGHPLAIHVPDAITASLDARLRLLSTHPSCTLPPFPLQDLSHTRELDPIPLHHDLEQLLKLTQRSYMRHAIQQPTVGEKVGHYDELGAGTN